MPLQSLRVAGGDCPALTGPLVQVWQLDGEQGRLEPIQSLVVTGQSMGRVSAAPQIAPAAGARRQMLVVGADRSAIAQGTQVLAGIEAERGCSPETPRPFVEVHRSVRLRRVLQKRQAVGLGDL